MALSDGKGFTLIELITALLLLAILAVYAIARWPGAGVNVGAQAEQLAGDIRYTQALAMNRGQRYRINLAADRYWIGNRDDSAREPHPVAGGADILLDRGIALAATHAYLVFDELGIPYGDALLPGTPLAADAVITLSAASASRTVRVSPETGRVAVQ